MSGRGNCDKGDVLVRRAERGRAHRPHRATDGRDIDAVRSEGGREPLGGVVRPQGIGRGGERGIALPAIGGEGGIEDGAEAGRQGLRRLGRLRCCRGGVHRGRGLLHGLCDPLILMRDGWQRGKEQRAQNGGDRQTDHLPVDAGRDERRVEGEHGRSFRGAAAAQSPPTRRGGPTGFRCAPVRARKPRVACGITRFSRTSTEEAAQSHCMNACRPDL